MMLYAYPIRKSRESDSTVEWMPVVIKLLALILQTKVS